MKEILRNIKINNFPFSILEEHSHEISEDERKLIERYYKFLHEPMPAGIKSFRIIDYTKSSQKHNFMDFKNWIVHGATDETKFKYEDSMLMTVGYAYLGEYKGGRIPMGHGAFVVSFECDENQTLSKDQILNSNILFANTNLLQYTDAQLNLFIKNRKWPEKQIINFKLYKRLLMENIRHAFISSFPRDIFKSDVFEWYPYEHIIKGKILFRSDETPPPKEWYLSYRYIMPIRVHFTKDSKILIFYKLPKTKTEYDFIVVCDVLRPNAEDPYDVLFTNYGIPYNSNEIDKMLDKDGTLVFER